MLLPSGNPIKCHEDVFLLSLQPMIPNKHFDISSFGLEDAQKDSPYDTSYSENGTSPTKQNINNTKEDTGSTTYSEVVIG